MTLLDALPWPAAILDHSGRIVAANARWRDATAEHRFVGPGFAVGDVYAAVCERRGGPEATEICAGVRAVLAGAPREAEVTHSAGRRFFRTTIAPYDHDGLRGALVCSRQGDDLFRAIVDASPDITSVLARDGTILFESESFERLLGHSAAEAVGQSGFSFVHPDDIDRAIATFAETTAEPGATRTLELRVRHHDGSYRHIELNARNLLDDPTVGGLLLTSRDVTDRIAADAALQSARARMSGILELTEDGVISVDADQRVTTYNKGAAKIFGYAPSEILGEPLSKLLPMRFAATHESLVRAFGEGRHAVRTMAERSRVAGRRKDGSEFQAEVSISSFDIGGERVLTAFVRDTSARDHAAEALRESKERLSTVVHGAPILLFALDRDGVFTLSEGKALESLGLAPGQVVGMSAYDLYKDVPDFRESFARALAGEVVHFTTALGRIAFDVMFAPLRDRGGNIIGITGVALDVSEKRKLEEQLLHAQRMESIGRLAGGVAHDFNNLLTVILSGADRLGEAFPPDDVRAGDVEAIAEAGRRAAALTGQLLSFARKQMISPKVVDLADNLARVRTILDRLLGKEIELVTRSQPGLHRVLVDPTHFDQIILNLAINARDAMPRGGRLTIELENVHLDDEIVGGHGEVTPGPHVRLVVSDTGEGMGPEVLAHVFEPFFTTKPQGKGTGLGLATCYGSVRQAGGHVRVESAPGQGTTFSVYLPSAPLRTEAARAGRTESTSPRVLETVLLVEDDSLVRSLAARILRGGGFDVLIAESGAEALEIARSVPAIQLLVTDIVMRGMNGKELATTLRAERPSLRVLYVSGYTEMSAVSQGSEDGVAFLPKPFTRESLLRMARELIPSR
ncbi:MAG: PAS domain S-box protein [Deltaproteobacteria bacterium]|nr:PAS domain S-box protein [Deltaproteobacteria bacterium]